MKKYALILLACALDVAMWVGLIALTVRSGLPLEWMLFTAFFGGLLIVVFGAYVCQNLAKYESKKRHATLLNPEELREQLRKFMVI